MADLNIPGESHAHSLVSAGHVDKTSGWSFSAEDGNKLLGKNGDDWDSYGKAHLGLDRGAKDKTKGRYKYPFMKGGSVYRSAIIAIKQRAAQQNDSAIEAAATKLLAQIDKVKSGKATTEKDTAMNSDAIEATLDTPLHDVVLPEEELAPLPVTVGETLIGHIEPVPAPVTAPPPAEDDEGSGTEKPFCDPTLAPDPGPRSYASIDDVRAALINETRTPSAVRASFETTVKAVDGQRALNFTISTASVDRMGDSIAVEGWDLSAYKKNPIVLWAHDASQPPIAKAVRVRAEDGVLKATASFVGAEIPGGIGAFAEGIYQLYKQGFLSATSVGFAPLEFKFSDDPKRTLGIDFAKQELLEFSCVPIPANAEALIEGRSVIPSKSYIAILDWIEASLRTNRERAVKFAESILGADGTDLFLREHAIRVLTASDEYKSPSDKRELADLRSWRATERKRIAAAKAKAARQRDLEIIKLRGK